MAKLLSLAIRWGTRTKVPAGAGAAQSYARRTTFQDTISSTDGKARGTGRTRPNLS
jgi:hypothetical protein